MRPLSVRTRIVTVITLVTALGLAAVGASVYIVERLNILEQVDVRLQANLDSARFIVAEGGDTGAWSTSEDALSAVVQRMSPDDNTGAIGMVDGAITTVPGMRLDLDLSQAHDLADHAHRVASRGEPAIATFAEGERTWRYLVSPIAIEGSPDPTEVEFVLAYDLNAELSEFDAAARMFVIASLIVIVVVAATGTVVATRLLRPLRHMRETAERVSAKSLDERIDVVGHDDVAELARTMNEMLDRLDSALDSQRQLLSDVGHELKTPITIVRGHLETMDPDDPTDTRETRGIAIDELERMVHLVQDLSSSAALHGPSPVRLSPTDASDLTRAIARKAAAIDGATVTTGHVATGVAEVDAARVTQAMLQLAQNAVTHGGGRIEIGSNVADGQLALWVRDHGPGVPDAMKERVFDRFTRGDTASGTAGSGLGLSIVQVIARAHDGTARIVDADGGGALFVLIFPQQARPTGV